MTSWQARLRGHCKLQKTNIGNLLLQGRRHLSRGRWDDGTAAPGRTGLKAYSSCPGTRDDVKGVDPVALSRSAPAGSCLS